MTIPAGSTSATFIVSTTAVASPRTANISGTLNGVTVSAPLTITAPTLGGGGGGHAGLVIAPTPVTGGSASTGMVYLSDPAPTGGIAVSLASDNPAATVPASVLIPAGAMQTSFPVPTTPVTATTVATITATLNGQSLSATLTITAPAAAEVGAVAAVTCS